MYKLVKIHKIGGVAIGLPSVLRLTDEANIPFDPANTDYQEYLKWLDEGNEPLPADE